MKAIVQRVSRASVTVDDKKIARIDSGMLILLGVKKEDSEKESALLAKKTANLRIFGDHEGKMNLSLKDINGQAIVVSQFTLYGNCKKGRRPSFINAALPEKADLLYQHYVQCLQNENVPVQTGQFQAMMQVEMINDGPVTIILDSDEM